ncbi:MAG: hypothetical protein LUE99_10070 [Bacteroides sp.]|nr:hypothetical protein [Bacteroides sp.]
MAGVDLCGLVRPVDALEKAKQEKFFLSSARTNFNYFFTRFPHEVVLKGIESFSFVKK